MRRTWLPTVLCLALLAPPALGQPRGKGAADALFKEGRVAFDKGDYEKACAKFAASLAIDPAAGTLLNLAVCEEKTGRLEDAKKHVDELTLKLPPKDDRVALVRELGAKVEARLPRLTLKLAPGAPPDTAVREGDRELPIGTPIVMTRGEHFLVVSASGRLAAEVRVTLAAEQREELAVAPGAAPRVQDQGPARSKVRWALGFAVGGLGVAGLATAAVTGVILLGKKAEVDEHCPGKRCTPEGLALKNAAESTPLLPVNTAAWIIGIAGVSAGAALVLTSGVGASRGATAIGPAMIAGSPGLAVGGVF